MLAQEGVVVPIVAAMVKCFYWCCFRPSDKASCMPEGETVCKVKAETFAETWVVSSVC